MTTKHMTVSQTKQFVASLSRVAADLLDVAAAAPAPVDGAGAAGPQEVVDALESVINDLSGISEAIPAEPSQADASPLGEAPLDAPVEEAPLEEDEEEPKLAKQVRELTARLEAQEVEKLATVFAELHDVSVQQAKYNESLGDSVKSLTAKIDVLKQYKQNEGASSHYAKAENMTSWINKSKYAKQSNEMMSL
jgi:hypothetical protein